jgi:hypothetical protein
MLKFKNSTDKVVMEMNDNGDVILKEGNLNGQKEGERQEGRLLADPIGEKEEDG